MNIIPIVFAFDNNLVLPACVCISSLMMNAKEDTFYDIFILHSERVNLEKEQLDKIPLYYTNCRVQYRQIDNTFDSAYEIRGITTATYYRLLIPELIPEYDKIIYSDVDVVFREDLSDVYLSQNDRTKALNTLKSWASKNTNNIEYLSLFTETISLIENNVY